MRWCNKERERTARREAWKRSQLEWRPWFAWYPVTDENRTAWHWLEWVERRRENVQEEPGRSWGWVYLSRWWLYRALTVFQ